MALNDEILEAAGSHWADCRPFDHGRLAQPVASELRARAAATLISEFGETERPVVKDPRMCRLLDFWEPVFKDVGWSTRVVLPIRSPLEVARSLETRDGMVAGVGCLLWLRHVLDAEARSRGSLRSFIAWSSLLTDRRGTLEHVAAQLELDWLLSSDEAMTDADAFVSSELRHFKSSAQETAPTRSHPNLQMPFTIRCDFWRTTRTTVCLFRGSTTCAASLRPLSHSLSRSCDNKPTNKSAFVGS